MLAQQKSSQRIGIQKVKPGKWSGPVRVIGLRGQREIHKSVSHLIKRVVDAYQAGEKRDIPAMVQPCRWENDRLVPEQRMVIDLRGVWKEIGVQ